MGYNSEQDRQAAYVLGEIDNKQTDLKERFQVVISALKKIKQSDVLDREWLGALL